MVSFTMPAAVAPVLETERLILRGHRPDDFDGSAAIWADPAVTRFIGGRPFTPEEVWSRLLRYAGLWTWLRFGYWAVEEKASRHFLGDVGFADFKREMEPSIEGLPELGWVLASQAQGKGYATEAVRAAIAWGAANLSAPKTVCLIHPDNQASLRVAEKAGFREYRRTNYKGSPAILLERPLAGI